MTYSWELWVGRLSTVCPFSVSHPSCVLFQTDVYCSVLQMYCSGKLSYNGAIPRSFIPCLVTWHNPGDAKFIVKCVTLSIVLSIPMPGGISS